MLDDKAVLFLSHLIPRELDDEVSKNSKNNMQEAANALQWHLVEGFSYNLSGRFDIVNFMPIASFPQYYKKMWIKGTSFKTSAESAYNIGFCNIKYIRRMSIANQLWKNVSAWCKDNTEKDKIIILYTLNGVALEVLSNIKRRFSNVTLCAIVADLPDMMNLSSKKGIVRKASEKITSKMSYSNVDIVDKFVFLTKHMSDYLGNTQPYCVMEGIATDVFADALVPEEKVDSKIKTVLYTGTLHKRFGVLHLLEAFSLIEDPDYRLIICGAGDSEKEIRDAAKKDSRIIFKGQCRREEVLRLQRMATVLVNPRMNNEEFTKYSFPSKNLEYLSSGTPLVAYKLDGIPDEYDEFIYYPKDSSKQELAESIAFICDMTKGTRHSIGNKNRCFVLENKNPLVQTEKIINLLVRD